MKIVCVYVYPMMGGFADYAERFVGSYCANPPMRDHQMIVVSNGGPPNALAVEQFSNIGGTMFLRHDNSGQDIGAYQMAAMKVPCDLMVFFGASAYFRRPGWLRRMVSAYQCYGEGLYGCTGNQGDVRFNVWPHVRTTGFWCNPKLLNEHPLRVSDNNQRYPFEHGEDGLTSWVLSKKLPALIVGWNQVAPLHQCDAMPGTFHKGNQENVLVGDRLTHPPFYHCP